MFLNLLLGSPAVAIAWLSAIAFTLTIHEFSHALVAKLRGDKTAEYEGRLTLNPLAHVDPTGLILLLLFGFGWAKPVPVNFSNLRDYRKGMILVSAAGITANITLAFLALLIMRMNIFSPWGIMTDILSVLARINMILAAFNLIPIPPLDGSKILMGFVSNRAQYQLMQLEPYGMFIIIGLLFFGLLNPLITFFEQIIVTIINLIL